MPKSTEPLTRHTILLTEGSYEKLQDLYRDTFGAAAIVRLLINSHIQKVERAAGPADFSVRVLEGEL